MDTVLYNTTVFGHILSHSKSLFSEFDADIFNSIENQMAANFNIMVTI